MFDSNLAQQKGGSSAFWEPWELETVWEVIKPLCKCSVTCAASSQQCSLFGKNVLVSALELIVLDEKSINRAFYFFFNLFASNSCIPKRKRFQSSGRVQGALPMFDLPL